MKRASKLLLPLAACVLMGAVGNAKAQKSTWVIDGGAHLVSPVDGRCLGIDGDVVPGKALSKLPCNGSASQVFENVGGQIKVGGLCLQKHSDPIVDVIVATCSTDSRQLWVVDSQRAIRAVGSPVCIWNGGGIDGGAIKTELCYDDPGQRWNAVTP